MGKRELSGTSTEGFTIGIEFEVAGEPLPIGRTWEEYRKTIPEQTLADWFDRQAYTGWDLIQNGLADPINPIDDDEIARNGDFFRHVDEPLDFEEMSRLYTPTEKLTAQYRKDEDERINRLRNDFQNPLTGTAEQTYDRLTAIIAKHLPCEIRPYDVKGDVKFQGGDKIVLAPDGSIKPAGVEIITPPLSFDEAVATIRTVFSLIDGKTLMTNPTTGLHINISVPRPEKIDLLKLALLLGEGHVLDTFSRTGNQYATPLMDLIKSHSIKSSDYQSLIDELNRHLTINASHYRTVDLMKLKYGYLEFRMTGGAGYENREKEIISLIKRYIRVIGLASDPMAERESYLKKLSALFPEREKAISWTKFRVTRKRARELLGRSIDPLLNPDDFAAYLSNQTDQSFDNFMSEPGEKMDLLRRIFQTFSERERTNVKYDFATYQVLRDEKTPDA